MGCLQQSYQQHMRQYSDDEQGFIPSYVEINSKSAPKTLQPGLRNEPFSAKFRVCYRFGTSFIKKQHPLALATPLSLTRDHCISAGPTKKSRPFYLFEHPHKMYCRSEEFSLLYSRSAREPFTTEREYMKNEVSLLNMEGKGNTSIKELKSFEEEDYSFSNDDLHFDSRFENGNLHCAFRRRNFNEYHLFMSNDTNTLGYNQWFYFSLRNMRAQTKYSFKVANYRKSLDFWKQGQQVALFSHKNASTAGTGWKWSGSRMNVEETNVRSYPERKQYMLTFELEFEHSNDYVLIASSVPYSYSKLIRELGQLEQEALATGRVKWKIGSVGTTLCNNEVPEVSITSSESAKADKEKKTIVIMARQHPGEVWSSYVCEGVMRALLKDSPESKYLLDNFIFKVFPMVNVDGVIYGNFRCDVTGVDLNRRWRQPSRLFHPQLFELKKRIHHLSKKGGIKLCLDLHGHSKKYNVFCYACKHNSYTCRLLPLQIRTQTELFHFPSCTFGLSKDKESTARAAISRIIKSQNVLTIETSSFGWRTSQGPSQYSPLHLHSFAESMMKATRYFVDKKCTKYKATEKDVKQNMHKYQQFDQENGQESGSDSEPEEDEIDFKVKVATIIDRKFQHQFKSFLKEDHAAQLHLSQIIFHKHDQHSEPRHDEIHSNRYPHKDVLNFQSPSQVLIQDKTKNEHSATKFLRAQKGDSPNLEHKKSMSVNHSKIGRQLPIPEIKSNSEHKVHKMFVTKNIAIPAKRVSKERESQALNPRDSIQDKMDKSNLFRNFMREEETRRLDNFVNKFEKFIPSSFSHKQPTNVNRKRLQMLEESLNRQDPTCSLNIMLENKRKIELQKIKKSIEDTTIIAERQGRVKMMLTRDPIIDFRKFKQNQRMKQQIKKMGELSQRYLEGQY